MGCRTDAHLLFIWGELRKRISKMKSEKMAILCVSQGGGQQW